MTIMKKCPSPQEFTDTQHAKNTAGTYDVSSTGSKYGKNAVVAQTLATIVTSLMLVNVGMELSMATIVIGNLLGKPNAEFVMTASQSSWYGSILYLCQPIGSCLSGYVQNRYGKKMCMVIACLPSIFGWILLWYAKSVEMLYMSTLTMGLGLGFNDGPAYSYIGEICEPRLRGIMSSLINMACLIGIMSSYGLGYLFNWHTVAMLSALCPILCLTLVVFIPESPIWLLSKGKNEKSMNAICWLRGWVDPRIVATEYQELLFYYKMSVEQSQETLSKTGIFASFAWIKNPSVYRPLCLATVYYIITLISCLTPCRPFIVKLMSDSGVKDTNSIALLLFGSMQLAGSVCLTITVQKLGKRMLTISTLCVNTLTILMFGVYTMCISKGLMHTEAYIPMALFSIIMFSGAMGVLTVPWTLVSELYPNESKGFASSMTTAIFYILTFLGTKVYLSVENVLGLTNTLFMLALFSSFGLVYLYKYMPETENKTLLEIEEFFVPKKKHNAIESRSLQP